MFNLFYLALRNYRFLNIGNLGSADFNVFGLSAASLNQSDLTFLSNALLASAWGSPYAVRHTLTFEWETRFKFLHKSQAKFIILLKFIIYCFLSTKNNLLYFYIFYTIPQDTCYLWWWSGKIIFNLILEILDDIVFQTIF